MRYCKIFPGCLILLFITACDSHEKSASVEKPAEVNQSAIPVVKSEKISPVPAKTTQETTTETTQEITQNTRPALNLSIDTIAVEEGGNGSDVLVNDGVHKNKNSTLFDTLSSKQSVSGTSISGELLSDQSKEVNNRDLLNSLDGVKLEVKGNF